VNFACQRPQKLQRMPYGVDLVPWMWKKAKVMHHSSDTKKLTPNDRLAKADFIISLSPQSYDWRWLGVLIVIMMRSKKPVGFSSRHPYSSWFGGNFNHYLRIYIEFRLHVFCHSISYLRSLWQYQQTARFNEFFILQQSRQLIWIVNKWVGVCSKMYFLRANSNRESKVKFSSLKAASIDTKSRKSI
jgi:hypothetical protein